MTEDREFVPYSKIHRLNRDIIVTEKIDGTNAAVVVTEDGEVYAQSRSRIINPADDNFGFAKWVDANATELAAILGKGIHFGEWWGQGIQRGYGLGEKRFSIFNVEAFAEIEKAHPDQTLVGVVPVLYRGPFDQAEINRAVEDLRNQGSYAVPGYMNAEGVVIWHTQGRFGLKVTLVKDEQPKSLLAVAA